MSSSDAFAQMLPEDQSKQNDLKEISRAGLEKLVWRIKWNQGVRYASLRYGLISHPYNLLAPDDPSANPTTTYKEEEAIRKYCQNAKVVVEIGTFEGYTGALMLKDMPSGGMLIAIDPFEALWTDGDRKFQKGSKAICNLAFKRAAAENKNDVSFEVIKQSSRDFDVSRFDKLGGIDLLFIDGDHSYDGCRADWDGFSPLVNPGGVVVIHDTGGHSKLEGPTRVAANIASRDPRFEFAEQANSMMVFSRNQRLYNLLAVFRLRSFSGNKSGQSDRAAPTSRFSVLVRSFLAFTQFENVYEPLSMTAVKKDSINAIASRIQAKRLGSLPVLSAISKLGLVGMMLRIFDDE